MLRTLTVSALTVVLLATGLTSRAGAAPDSISDARPGARASRTGDTLATSDELCAPAGNYSTREDRHGPNMFGPTRIVLHQFDGNVTDDPVIPGLTLETVFTSPGCQHAYTWRALSGTFARIDVRTGRTLAILRPPGVFDPSPPPHVRPNGSLAIVDRGNDKDFVVMDAITEDTIWSVPGAFRTAVTHSSFRLDGDRAVVALFRHGSVVVIDRASQRVVTLPLSPRSIKNVSMSPDGNFILVTTSDSETPSRIILSHWDGRAIGEIALGTVSATSGFISNDEFVVCTPGGMARFTLDGRVTATEVFESLTTPTPFGGTTTPGWFACTAAFDSIR